MRTRSIRTRITLITIAAILTTVLAIFAACYSTVQKENDRRSSEMMNLITMNTKEYLEKDFDNIERACYVAAGIADDAFTGTILLESGVAGRYANPEKMTESQREQLDQYLTECCRSIQKPLDGIADRTNGVTAYYLCIAPEVSETVHGFFYSKTGKAGFEEMDAINVADLEPSKDEEVNWYDSVRRKGRPSWEGPLKDAYTNGEWVCSFIVPIYKSGTCIGILGMDIPIDNLASLISSIKVYDTGYAFLLDDGGQVIYHPYYEIGAVPEELSAISENTMTKEAGSGEDVIRYEYNGEESQLSQVTLSNGMQLAVTAPTDEINASWMNLLRIVVMITTFIVVLFAAIVMIVMSIITQPLKDLTDASQRLVDGEFDVRLEYSRQDEIGILTGAFVKMRDQLRKYIADLNHRINADALTDLPNMRRFFVLAEQEKKRLEAEGKHPAIVYFNLIGMKHINRQYGFEEGDRLICLAGDILADHYGKENTGRLAGDHFAVITMDEEIETRTRQVLDELHDTGAGTALNVSAGIYSFSLEDVSISVACDRAKYACDMHRGTFTSDFYVFDEDMVRETEDLRYIIGSFNEALSENWIEVYYQPIIDSISGKICDVEALSRWFDPEKGYISPATFVPVLENAKLIYLLDLYVLDHIIAKICRQKEAGIPVVPHSINLSRADFDSCDIVDELCRRIDASGLERRLFSVEITESMVGSDFEFMKSQVVRLRELGFKVWMDDFGSGYSSLDVLQEIRFDMIKFDMRFMNRFEEGRESRIILDELVDMAKELGIDTLCEGVETARQADFLRSIGCHKMQGFYFSKPLSCAELFEEIRRGNLPDYKEFD